MYICKICSYKSEKKLDRCPNCGHKNTFEIIKYLTLESLSGEKFILYEKEKIFMRKDFRVFGEKARFVSREGQVKIYLDENRGWMIKHIKTAKNPTLLNGNVLGEKSRKLKNGDEIRVGELVIKIKI